jgi:glycine/D-amino acid oxidase-like deaminating enzyme
MPSSTNTPSKRHVIHLRQPNGTLFIPFSNVVLAAGAWTPEIYRTLFPTSDLELPIASISGHSLLLRSSHWKALTANEEIETDAVFATDERGEYFPEMFYRADGESRVVVHSYHSFYLLSTDTILTGKGTIWLGGINHTSTELPLPSPSGKAAPLASSISKLRETAEYLYDLPSSSMITDRESVCFRPVTPASVPIVARVPEVRLGRGWRGQNGPGGVYVAAGHGPWGISGSLGTGKVVSEMLLEENVTADLSELGIQEGNEGWAARARL